jgi:hypothetical protein
MHEDVMRRREEAGMIEDAGGRWQSAQPARLGMRKRTIVTTFAVVNGERTQVTKETHRIANANKGSAAPVAPGKVRTADAKVDPIIGRQFMDAWGLKHTILRTEPGHVWARAGGHGAVKRYLRSKIRPCLLPV